MYLTPVGNLFVIPTVDVRTESFPNITVLPKKVSNQESAASKINVSASVLDKINTSLVSKNGDAVKNDVLNFNVNGEYVYYCSLYLGIATGVSFFIFLCRIWMYKARTRCRPEKYKDPLKI
ncbi:hypothetical protein CHS0354_008732 [Potamilus streckersoni]|uniref:Uncharacterized protein n=1 Tax=Potamilus streckersoni TaxID=2493646 RepID=A0AAE0TID4_9BIVA|nr:hypothetical protein CHS0354_008732 [Potamilus streckersoni]